MKPPPHYDAVLCDIDGVIRHWPAADPIEHAHGFPIGAITAAAFAPPRFHPVSTGVITHEQWLAAVAADLADEFGSATHADAAMTAWSDLDPRVDQDVVALLTRTRTVTTLALLSNATTRLDHDLTRQGLHTLADTVLNTAHLGIAKPDPRVYLIAAERVGAAVHRCLFIDDSLTNVTAARDVGMTAVHYHRLDDLRDALAPLFGE